MSQMILTVRLRRIILHLSHIFFTEARTFIENPFTIILVVLYRLFYEKTSCLT